LRVEFVNGRVMPCWACGYESHDNLRVVFNGKSIVLCPNHLRELGDLIHGFFMENWWRYERKKIYVIVKNGRKKGAIKPCPTL